MQPTSSPARVWATGVATALLLAACAGSEPEVATTTPAASEAPTPQDTPSAPAPSPSPSASPTADEAAADEAVAGQVDPGTYEVTLACTSGEVLSALPFDPSIISVFGEGTPPEETRWIRSVLELRNDGDEWIQLQREFPVRLLDADGSELATGNYFAAQDEQLAAAPGETVLHVQNFFDGMTGLFGLEEEQRTAVHDALASCEAADTVVSAREPAPLPDELSADEFLCTSSDDRTAVLGGWYVENTGTADVEGAPLLALRDGEGRRLATNGGLERTAAAGATTEITEGVPLALLPDPTVDYSCELFAWLPPRE